MKWLTFVSPPFRKLRCCSSTLFNFHSAFESKQLCLFWLEAAKPVDSNYAHAWMPQTIIQCCGVWFLSFYRNLVFSFPPHHRSRTSWVGLLTRFDFSNFYCQLKNKKKRTVTKYLLLDECSCLPSSTSSFQYIYFHPLEKCHPSSEEFIYLFRTSYLLLFSYLFRHHITILDRVVNDLSGCKCLVECLEAYRLLPAISFLLQLFPSFCLRDNEYFLLLEQQQKLT